MSDSLPAIEKLRARAGFGLSIGATLFAFCTAAGGYVLPIGSLWPGIFALGFAGMVFLGHRMASAFGRQLIGLGIVGGAMAFVSIWANTGWQVDAHFSFLAFLAILLSLYDVKVIVVATGAIVLHHLGFGMLFHAYVFPSSDILENVLRAVFHAVMVIVLDIAIVTSIIARLRMERQNADALANARQEAASAAEARADAEQALAAAEQQRQETEESERKANALVVDLENAEKERQKAADEAKVSEDAMAAERAEKAKDQEHLVATLRSALSRLANRDFSTEITETFPPAYAALKHDYNSAIANLKESLVGVSRQSQELKVQIETINESAAAVSKRSEQQVHSMEMTATAVHELNLSVTEFAEVAEQSASSAQGVQTQAHAGNETVGRAVEAMKQIQDSSNEIAKINALIDGIAFQTNLLALNAGVEAARAGEAGRGFAVVASEVRALSLRTTEAANDIGQLIQRSQEQVAQGAELVTETGEHLTGIVDDLEKMTKSSEGIMRATKGQADGLSDITSAIAELDGIAQGNAAMFEETSAACSALNDGMDRMFDTVGTFSLSTSDQDSPISKAG